jgi:membrane-associated PAP2 superfamily phosphatase
VPVSALPDSATSTWWRHARWPLRVFITAAPLFALTRLDLMISRALFFDSSSNSWRGAGNWWIDDIVHTGGRWLVRAVVVVTLAQWLASFIERPLQGLRRPAGYLGLAIVSTVGAVGLLKTLTNVDCPWDLQEFGGRFPYVHLFAARSAELRQAQCFPAAHASSGYALMALYFVAYERSRRLARLGLAAGVMLGLVFGIAQQARGAHFASHDLWSAFLAWIISLTLYVFAFRARLYPRAD